MSKKSNRSAIFLDFDNIYLGLEEIDPTAAKVFATKPRIWIDWLATGGDTSKGKKRNFLDLVCYYNPVSFWQSRRDLVHAGFRIVDCPPLTRSGKTSADIYMAIDIIDILQHPVRYDEIILASADADFTPVLHRLRAHDRSTTILTTGITSASYNSICDNIILPETFVKMLLSHKGELPKNITNGKSNGSGKNSASKSSARSKPFFTNVNKNGSHTPAIPMLSIKQLNLAIAAVHTVIEESPTPVTKTKVAQAVCDAAPDIIESKWAGQKTFQNFITQYVPEMTSTNTPEPGYIFDKSRHSIEDVSQEKLGQIHVVPLNDVQKRITEYSGAPNLSTEQYQILFRETARILVEEPEEVISSISVFPKILRDGTLEGKISRKKTKWLVENLNLVNTIFPKTITPQDLSIMVCNRILLLCEENQHSLSQEETKELISWVTGDSDTMLVSYDYPTRPILPENTIMPDPGKQEENNNLEEEPDPSPEYDEEVF